MSPFATVGLAVRSLLWTLLLPGMVGHYIPWRYLGLRDAVFNARDPLHWIAIVAVATGATRGADVAPGVR